MVLPPCLQGGVDGGPDRGSLVVPAATLAMPAGTQRLVTRKRVVGHCPRRLPVGEEVPMDTTAAVLKPWRLNPYDIIVAVIFAVSLLHFTFCLLWALDQPILDLWGFRPAQTAISVPFIMSGRG